MCNSFSSLYVFAMSKESWVVELWEDLRRVDIGFHVSLGTLMIRNWTLLRFLSFFHVARDDDKITTRWFGKKHKGLFLVKSFYAALKVGRTVHFPMNIVWNPWVPSNVSFFAWEASWGKVLTLDNLQKIGRPLVNKYYLCKLEGESIDHILLHYSKARILWHLLFSLFNVDWVIPFSVKDILLSWHDSLEGKKRKKVWKAVLFYIFLNNLAGA